MPHVSFSQIQMLEGCPEQHRLKYVKEMPQTFSHEVLIGQAAHKLPEMCLRDLQEGKPLRSRSEGLEEVEKYFWEHADDETISFLSRWGGFPISREKCLSDALRIARVMYDELLPTVEEGTWQSEWDFDIPIPGCEGWTFKGSIDHVRVIPAINDGTNFNVIVDDWKTTGKMWGQSKADESLQATAYSWAVHRLIGVYPKKIVFSVFTRPTSKNDVTWKAIETKRKIAQVRKFEAKLRWAVKLIQSHDPESPSEKRTSWEYHKYCPYRQTCTPWEFSDADPVSIR